MSSCALIVVSFLTMATTTAGPRLGGAFIQLDGCNNDLTPKTWESELAKMRAAKLDIVIVQYLEARTDDPMAPEEYIPKAGGDPDPLKAILDDADRHGMKVFVGLRYDARLLESDFLDDAEKLKTALADELGKNIELINRVTERYRLKARASFAGWYLPVEVANFTEAFPGQTKGWIAQLSNFTQKLVRACHAKVDILRAARNETFP